MQDEFSKKYNRKIEGVLGCYDRVVIKGTLHEASYADGMMNILNRRNIKFVDYPKYTDRYRNQIISRVKQISKEQDIPIQFIRKSGKVRKEDLVKGILDGGDISSGLVCILSVMESCNNYRYHYDKEMQRSRLLFSTGKCLHYYFYFIDKDYGLCYLRVPTWCPFQLQFYFNGHNWLANKLDKAGISYELRDNAFVHVEDYAKAQQISDKFEVRKLHQRLDYYVGEFCPAVNSFCPLGYRWSIMQLEYATDLVFKDGKTLAPIYDEIIRNVMYTVTPDDVARFLGRKYLHGKNNLDLDTSHKQTRQEMRRLKHRMGACSVKMYDKFGRVLRIETTTNNTTEFYHYRSVGHRDGTKTSKVAPVKKGIYSLKALVLIMNGCNSRYLKYIAAFDAPIAGKKRLKKISKSSKVNQRSYKGFNFFDENDAELLKLIAKADFTIKGFKNQDLKGILTNKSTGQISRIIKRLHVKGLIKRVTKRYRYHLTTLGQKVIVTALKLKEIFITQELNYPLAS